MRKQNFRWMLFVISIVLAAPVYAAPSSPAQTTTENELPLASASQSRFVFGTVVEGTAVLHDFIIENKGQGTLTIEKVQTSCGCTTASYDKTIAPGTEGKISIEGNTRGYGGRKFSKTITVYTNDPHHKQIKLYISGSVDAFALVKPERVYLTGTAKQKIQSTVTVTPLEHYPFNITESHTDKGLKEKVVLLLEKKKDRYVLTVKNNLKEPGNYQGRIHLKTDSSVKPEITILVAGNIKAAK